MKGENLPPSTISTTGQRGDDRLVAYGTLLVSVDFSEHSKKTIEYAMQLAAFTGAAIKIMHVCQLPELPADFYEGNYVERELVTGVLEIAKREAIKRLSVVTGQIEAKGLNTETVLRVGKPYEEIVGAAKELDADLIVIGSHGYSGAYCLASNAERVVRYPPCAVLVVK